MTGLGADRAATDPVERYLDDLFRCLHGDPRHCRRLLAEAESHLLDGVDAGMARGLTRAQAGEQAVADFGPRFVLVHSGPSAMGTAVRLIRPLLQTGSWVVATGLLVAGATGVIDWMLRIAFGDRFLAGDQATVQYSAARCSDFFEYAPNAASCLDAAASHHADEVVRNGIAFGLLGLMVLGMHRMLRRRWRPRDLTGALPTGFGAGIATTVFTGIGAVCLLSTVSTIGVGRVDGGGQYLSTAVACTAAGQVFAWRWLRAVGGADRALVEPPV